MGIDEKPPAPEPKQSEQTSEPAKAAAPKTSNTTKRFCSKCGKEIDATSYTCPFCGEKPWDVGTDRWSQVYDSEYTYSDSGTLAKDKSSSPVAGGILAILAGVLALGQGLIYMAGSAVVNLPGALCLCGGIDFLFGAAAVFGGICAIKREHFAIALIGALLGMLGLGLLIGFLFGLIALILIALSKDEFD